MSDNDKKLIEEHIKLQNEFMEYISKNGFDYGEYCAPSPGSYYEGYRKRWLELTHALAPQGHYPSSQ